jgi:hypothetical protein
MVYDLVPLLHQASFLMDAAAKAVTLPPRSFARILILYKETALVDFRCFYHEAWQEAMKAAPFTVGGHGDSDTDFSGPLHRAAESPGNSCRRSI